MKFHDVLADDVDVRRPEFEFRVRECGAGVIHQRVEPDVGDELLVEGQGNAPVQPRQRTRDAQVFERVVFEKAEDFIAAVIRRDERRIRFDVINEPLLMGPQLEPIVAFLQFDDLTVSRIKRPVGQAVFVSQESFFLGRVKAFVGCLVKMSCVVELRKKRLDEFLVTRLGGADEIIIGQFKFLRKRLPVGGQFVAVGLRCFAFGDGGLLDLLAVFVQAGQGKNLLAQTAPRPRDHVSDDHFVSMAQMRLAVHVINRGGDVKPFVHQKNSVTHKSGIGNPTHKSDGNHTVGNHACRMAILSYNAAWLWRKTSRQPKTA